MSIASPPLALEDLEHILSHTQHLWEEARGQSFFITGGTGFFGVWLLESFAYINDRLRLAANATVLTRYPDVFTSKMPHLASRQDLQFLAGDIRDFAFPAGKFPFIVHAATSTKVSPDATAQLILMDEVISGTRHVLNFAGQASPKKLLLTSSGAVYGPQPTTLTHIPESHTGSPDSLTPGSSYGLSKRLAEHLCVIHSHSIGYEAKIARCFAFVGPHLPIDGRYAIGNFIRDAQTRPAISVDGDGTAVRSYLYAADLAIWLWTILFRGHSARAYNVGSMDDLSIAEVAETVRAALNAEKPVRIALAPVPGGVPSRYVPSTKLAQADLGLQNRFPLKDAIRRTAHWNSQYAATRMSR